MDLTDLARSLAHKMQPLVSTTGHRLIFKDLDGRCIVRADGYRLEQVLQNLLDNAVRYSDPETDIVVTMERPETSAVIEVKNEGPEISERERQQLFQPFHRGNVARTLNVRGSGLGLSICKEIVESHGGHIWVESDAATGTTFSFSIPVLSDEEAQALAAEEDGAEK